MHKQNNYKPIIHFNFVLVLLILLLKTVDFEKKKECTFCNVIGDFISFSNLAEANYKFHNGGLHWLDRSQKFDFKIAITFLFIIRF